MLSKQTPLGIYEKALPAGEWSLIHISEPTARASTGAASSAWHW